MSETSPDITGSPQPPEAPATADAPVAPAPPTADEPPPPPKAILGMTDLFMTLEQTTPKPRGTSPAKRSASGAAVLDDDDTRIIPPDALPDAPEAGRPAARAAADDDSRSPGEAYSNGAPSVVQGAGRLPPDGKAEEAEVPTIVPELDEPTMAAKDAVAPGPQPQPAPIDNSKPDIRAVTPAAKKPEIDSIFRSFVEFAPIAMFRLSAQGRLTHLNPAMARMLGCPNHRELIGVAVGEKVFADAGEFVRLAEKLAGQTGLLERETAWKAADGTPLQVRLRLRKLTDAGGKLRYIEGSAQDVTPFFEREQQLLAELQQLRTLAINGRGAEWAPVAARMVTGLNKLAVALDSARGVVGDMVVALTRTPETPVVGDDAGPNDRTVRIDPVDAPLWIAGPNESPAKAPKAKKGAKPGKPAAAAAALFEAELPVADLWKEPGTTTAKPLPEKLTPKEDSLEGALPAAILGPPLTSKGVPRPIAKLAGRPVGTPIAESAEPDSLAAAIAAARASAPAAPAAPAASAAPAAPAVVAMPPAPPAPVIPPPVPPPASPQSAIMSGVSDPLLLEEEAPEAALAVASGPPPAPPAATKGDKVSLKSDPDLGALPKPATKSSSDLPRLPTSGWLDVNEMVKESMNDIRKRMAEALIGKPFTVRLKTKLAATTPVKANPQEIKDIIVQLVACAVRAMSGPAIVTITTATVAKGTMIAVTDDRTTISAGFKARLFDPTFVSNNERLQVLRACGMAMSRHGGKVGVLSEPNIGTTVTMRFPRPKALE